jgi:hypothetical protein
VPLSDLVEHDAVDEPAEPQTQDDAWNHKVGRPGRRRAERFHAAGIALVAGLETDLAVARIDRIDLRPGAHRSSPICGSRLSPRAYAYRRGAAIQPRSLIRRESTP